MQKIKETKMYKFSIPMPFQKENIDKLIEINNEIKKSKITSLYFALPSNCQDQCGFEQTRVYLKDVGDSFDYWKPLIQYSIEVGFDFIYLLNLPLSFDTSNLSELNYKLKKLHNLLLMLQDVGVNKLRVANTQIMNYLRNNYSDFKIVASTSLEYYDIKSFNLFFKAFPKVKHIVPSHNANKNFMLLKNLKEKYPDVTFELMVHEGCHGGCPFRNNHCITNSYFSEHFNNIHEDFTRTAFLKMCGDIASQNPFEQICKSNNIYPWEIETYSKIGINDFKLVGRNTPEFNNGEYINFYRMYLKGVDDFKNIENEQFRCLINYILNNPMDLKVGEAKDLLPDIRYFIQNGHLCSSRCGVECHYCEECARKLEEKFGSRLGYLKERVMG